MDWLIRLIWWVHWHTLCPLTYRHEGKSYAPRSWARHIGIGPFRLIDAPWLWCRCGDSLETWREVQMRQCWTCGSIQEAEDMLAPLLEGDVEQREVET